jgi:hypothetical protein
MLTIDDIPMSIYQQIEANNNTEILISKWIGIFGDESQKYIITIKIKLNKTD